MNKETTPIEKTNEEIVAGAFIKASNAWLPSFGYAELATSTAHIACELKDKIIAEKDAEIRTLKRHKEAFQLISDVNKMLRRDAQSELTEARAALAFYASKDSWFCDNNKEPLIADTIDCTDWGFENGKMSDTGGITARSFFEKYPEVKNET